MDITFALLADAANVSAEGKLNILGVFSTLSASSTPVVHPQLVLVLKVEAGVEEVGVSHQLKITLKNEGNSEIAALPEFTFELPRMGFHNAPDSNLILVINGTVFPSFGRYYFDLALDGKTSHQIPIEVIPMAESESSTAQE